jgi:anti-sigma B factor antagonist
MTGGRAFSAARLRVEVVRDDDVDVVVAAGEVDVATNVRLARALHRLTNDHDRPAVVDLRQVRFMDSTGVHHLLHLHRQLVRQGRSLTVVCAPGPVYRLLVSLGLVETLNLIRR